MRYRHSLLTLGVSGVTFVLGWLLGTQRPVPQLQKPGAAAAKPGITAATAPAGGGNSSSGSVPAAEQAFLKPVTEEDRALVREKVHEALEKAGGYPDRMAAVCAALARLTPENAAEFARAFNESWLDGHDFATERTLFFFRLGEVTGADGLKHQAEMKEISSGDRDRVIEGWAGVDAAAATAWVNALPDDRVPDGFIDSVFWGAGMRKPEHALEIFKVQDEHRQAATFDSLMRIYRLRGGNEAVTELAGQMLDNPDPAMQKWGTQALKKARQVYAGKSPEELNRWLQSLPPTFKALAGESKP